MGIEIKVQIQIQFFSPVQQRPKKLSEFAKLKFNFENLTTNEPGLGNQFYLANTVEIGMRMKLIFFPSGRNTSSNLMVRRSLDMMRGAANTDHRAIWV